MDHKIVTLTRHIFEQESQHPEATGALSLLLYQITLAAKIISAQVNKAGLAKILGSADRINIQGELVQKLDDYANRIFIEALDHTGHIAGIASEEEEDIVPIRRQHRGGRYIVLLDPLDGSSNIDVNVSIGTIFSIYRRLTEEGTKPKLEDFLQQGKNLVCAGYVIYGSSTMLVYTSGDGVHGFTLDPAIGEFLLSHPKMCAPERCKVLSINESYEERWHEWTRHYINFFKEKGGFDGKITNRYIGSFVADFHRNLIYGGVFLYPADQKNLTGKLRLLFEAQPLAFIAANACQYASTGEQAILEIQPEELHQRVPLIIGNVREVKEAERYYKKYGL